MLLSVIIDRIFCATYTFPSHNTHAHMVFDYGFINYMIGPPFIFSFSLTYDYIQAYYSL